MRLVAYGEADAAILRACGLPGRFLWLADTVELPSDPARGDGPWPAGIELLQAMERLERIEDREARVADALAEADDAGDEEQARHHAEMAEIDAKLARREAETVNALSARLATEDLATLHEVERHHANAEAALREFRRAAGQAGAA